jgi:hypothetical protein
MKRKGINKNMRRNFTQLDAMQPILLGHKLAKRPV